MLRLSKAAVTVATVFYGALVVAWLLFRAWKGETWPMIGLLNAGGLWWFAPLLVLLPVALLVRARQATLCAGALLLAALALFGGDLWPHRPRRAPDATPTVRVLSFNTLVANQDFAAVIELIRVQQPDVVAIQELSPEMAEAVTAALGERYPYQMLSPWGDPRGIGLWSRFPMEPREQLDLALWEGWAQTALINVDGQPLFLVNVHLWPIGTLDRAQFAKNLARQRTQAIILRDLAASVEGAMVVVGDFNASPTNDAYALLDEVMDDAWRKAGGGPGFTWPAPGSVHRWARPFLRIDYQWVRGPVQPLRLQVLPYAGSDHLPTLGEYAVGLSP